MDNVPIDDTDFQPTCPDDKHEWQYWQMGEVRCMHCPTFKPAVKVVEELSIGNATLRQRNAELDAKVIELKEMLRRYTTEVPLGHQPHMLAEKARIACGLIPASGEGE